MTVRQYPSSYALPNYVTRTLSNFLFLSLCILCDLFISCPDFLRYLSTIFHFAVFRLCCVSLCWCTPLQSFIFHSLGLPALHLTFCFLLRISPGSVYSNPYLLIVCLFACATVHLAFSAIFLSTRNLSLVWVDGTSSSLIILLILYHNPYLSPSP